MQVTRTIAAAPILILAFSTAATAENFNLQCTRTYVDSSPYTSQSAADEWNPRKATLQVRGDDVYYGDIRGDVRVEGSRYHFDFLLETEMAGGAIFEMTVTYVPRTGRYFQNMKPPGGYLMGNGAGGTCERS